MLIDLLKRRFTTKNWDHTKPVTEQQVDYILECLDIAPAKTAFPGYEIIALTDSDEGKKLKNWLFYDHSWTSNGYRAVDSDKDRDYKGQYLAPLVLCFFNNLNTPRRGMIPGGYGMQETNLPNEGHRDANIFMSCMTAILAAEELGLNSGISTCHDMVEVAEHFGMSGYKCTIALGVGYAIDQKEILEQDGWYTDVLDPVTNERLGNLVVNFPAGRNNKELRELRPDIKSITKFI
jgi:nitroreductase